MKIESKQNRIDTQDKQNVKNKFAKGFTLLELLVVVVIIGILAAIALPQYQKIIEKSKASQAFVLLKELAQEQEEYYISHGEYSKKFENLTADIKWQGTKGWQYALHTDTVSNDDWSLQLLFNHNAVAIQMMRIKGKYMGGGFVYYLFYSELKSATGKIICKEGVNLTYYPFEETKGSYCENIFHGTLIDDRWNTNLYVLN